MTQEISRVVISLLNNAFYAVREKDAALSNQSGSEYIPKVSLKISSASDSVCISVSDNGSGIPADIVEKIFQPFFTTKPTGQGTGLGLSISYDIVKAHKGELKVQTDVLEGTTFTVKLPKGAA